MIDPGHGGFGIVRQCAPVSISRSSFYYQGKGESPLNLALMRLIDEQFLEPEFAGRRRDLFAPCSDKLVRFRFDPGIQRPLV